LEYRKFDVQCAPPVTTRAPADAGRVPGYDSAIERLMPHWWKRENAGSLPSKIWGTAMPEDQPTREELIEARERLKEQLAIVANPMNRKDHNPQLEAKLRAMIDDITDCLAEPATET
jgi:hypothetical protein